MNKDSLPALFDIYIVKNKANSRYIFTLIWDFSAFSQKNLNMLIQGSVAQRFRHFRAF